MLNEVLYLGSNNPITLGFKWAEDFGDFKKGAPVPFASRGVTKVEVYINGQTVSSDLGKITFVDGAITMDLDNTPTILAKQRYPISIRVWDPRHPVRGQLICHPKMKNSRVIVEAATSEV